MKRLMWDVKEDDIRVRAKFSQNNFYALLPLCVLWMRRTVRESRFVYNDVNPNDVVFFGVEMMAVDAVVDVVVDVEVDRLLLKPGGR